MKIVRITLPIIIILIQTINLSAKDYFQGTDTTLYNALDTLISFPKFTYKDKLPGRESLCEFYKDSLIYPKIQDCIGRVIVKFIVEKDSSLSNIELFREIPGCSEYNNEALRLVHLMNRLWTPATKGNDYIRIEMVVPVIFHNCDN